MTVDEKGIGVGGIDGDVVADRQGVGGAPSGDDSQMTTPMAEESGSRAWTIR